MAWHLCSGAESKKDSKDAKSKSASGLKKGKPNVVMFVGLQGSGKTTTCMKCALSPALRALSVDPCCCPAAPYEAVIIWPVTFLL